MCLSLLDSEEATLALRCWMGRWLGVLEAALLRRERGGLCVLGSIRPCWLAMGVGHRGWQALPQGVLWIRDVCSAFLCSLLLRVCRSSDIGLPRLCALLAWGGCVGG